jgi:hypothetical protein
MHAVLQMGRLLMVIPRLAKDQHVQDHIFLRYGIPCFFIYKNGDKMLMMESLYEK